MAHGPEATTKTKMMKLSKEETCMPHALPGFPSLRPHSDFQGTSMQSLADSDRQHRPSGIPNEWSPCPSAQDPSSIHTWNRTRRGRPCRPPGDALIAEQDERTRLLTRRCRQDTVTTISHESEHVVGAKCLKPRTRREGTQTTTITRKNTTYV